MFKLAVFGSKQRQEKFSLPETALRQVLLSTPNGLSLYAKVDAQSLHERYSFANSSLFVLDPLDVSSNRKFYR
jgi:hypothetical protein